MGFSFWTGSGGGGSGSTAASSGGATGPGTTACGLNGHNKKNIPFNALPTTMNQHQYHHHHHHPSTTSSTQTSLHQSSSLTSGPMIPSDFVQNNPSSMAATAASALQSDNKYAKRRSQIQALKQRYRIRYSMANINRYYHHRHQRRYMILVAVTIAFTIISFWVVSSNLAANYAGSQEDVRSLQDLADSIRRLRIRRKQALQHHNDDEHERRNGGTNQDIGGGGGIAGQDDDPTTTNRRYRRHGRDDTLYLPPRSAQQQQQGLLNNRIHRVPRESNAKLLGVDAWGGKNSDGEGRSDGGSDNGGANNGHHRPAATATTTTTTTTTTAATTITKRNQGQLSGSSTHSIQYEPSDHGGDREQPERLDRDAGDVEEELKMVDEDEETRLERLEDKIRKYQEINVQEEVRAKRLEDKMAASIEALKEYSSQHQQTQHGRDGRSGSSVGDNPANSRGSPTDVDPLRNMEEESFTS